MDKKPMIGEMSLKEMREEIKTYVCDKRKGFAFVSYSHKDMSVVYPKVLQWMREGYNIYIDVDFENHGSHENWVDIMENNIVNAKLAICFRSENYEFSYATLLELITMLSSKTVKKRLQRKVPIDIIAIPTASLKDPDEIFSSKEVRDEYEQYMKTLRKKMGSKFGDNNKAERDRLAEGLREWAQEWAQNRLKEDWTYKPDEVMELLIEEPYENDNAELFFGGISLIMRNVFKSADLNGNIKSINTPMGQRFAAESIYQGPLEWKKEKVKEKEREEKEEKEDPGREIPVYADEQKDEEEKPVPPKENRLITEGAGINKKVLAGGVGFLAVILACIVFSLGGGKGEEPKASAETGSRIAEGTDSAEITGGETDSSTKEEETAAKTNPNPEETDSAETTGEETESSGKEEESTEKNEMWTEDGITYTGHQVDGKLEGEGFAAYEDGSVYEGTFRNGLREGQGTLTYGAENKNGAEKYEGQWKNDHREGYGIMYWLNKDRYEGDWVGDKRQGTGKFYWVAGSRYEGNWVDGNMEGSGTYYGVNGSRYEGQWVKGKRHGTGVSYSPDGDKIYEGQWADNKREGTGTCYYEDGERYEGEWVANQREGTGTYYYKSGSRYEGEWVAGKKEGTGTMYYKDGTKKTGTWKAGNFVEE